MSEALPKQQSYMTIWSSSRRSVCHTKQFLHWSFMMRTAYLFLPSHTPHRLQQLEPSLNRRRLIMIQNAVRSWERFRMVARSSSISGDCSRKRGKKAATIDRTCISINIALESVCYILRGFSVFQCHEHIRGRNVSFVIITLQLTPCKWTKFMST